MALWPFRRKSGRKRSRSGATLSDHEAPPRSLTVNDAMMAATGTATPKKQRTDQPKKLHRRARTYSFSPGRNDSIRVGTKGSVPPVPERPAGSNPAGANDDVTGEYAWQRVPTLHNNRSGQHLPRRKSSKRRREELDREAEIKAMSNFMPVRPATDTWTAGRPMKKDSKRVKTGLGFRKKSWEDPSSDVSLPIPESIHSSMSSDSEFASYRVSTLESLAPRPTLRYTVYPRWGPASGSGPTRTSSQRRKLTDRAPISESTLKSHKRIDSLADDLDAADLRELMERDKRRREQKTQRDQERMERRLARRAEKQKAAEAEAARNGTPPPQNLERGVMGREMVGLGIDTTSAVVTSSKRRPSDVSPKQLGKMPIDATQPAEEEKDSEPFNHFHRTSSIPLDTPALTKEAEEPLPPQPESPKSRGGFLRSKKSRSKSPLSSDHEKHTFSVIPKRVDELETSRKTSEASSKGRYSFSSFFKWGAKNRRSSAGPSSFSNTSREEMQAAAQTHPVVAPIAITSVPRKMSSGVPKRTRSRFREDLPELPISPPDSRMQSPETEPALPVVSEARSGENTEENTPAAIRYDTPTSGHRSLDEAMRQTPTSWQRSLQQHSPEPQSVSLASIDSEASWLSGRLKNRPSSGMKGSLSRYQQHSRTHSNDSSGNHTEEDLAEDEYLSNLATPSRELHSSTNPLNRKSTGDARPSSDEDETMEEADMKWGSVVARQIPNVVHPRQHDAEKMKSREGLLNSFNEEGSEADEAEAEEPIAMQRATSINLGKGHARHISAGSAKLLQLTPRASVDSKRISQERRSSGPMFL